VVAIGAATFAAEQTLPASLQRFNASRAEPGVLVALELVCAAALLVANIGLYRFWRPARGIYAAALSASLVVTLLTGPYVIGELQDLFESSMRTLPGLILVTVYLTPVKYLFEGAAPAVVHNSPPVQTRRFCPACGAGSRRGAFCQSCGQRLAPVSR